MIDLSAVPFGYRDYHRSHHSLTCLITHYLMASYRLMKIAVRLLKNGMVPIVDQVFAKIIPEGYSAP